MKVCSFCGNKNISEKKTQYIYKHDNHFLLVNDVPCEECDYCGEQYFQSKVLKKIENDFLALQGSTRQPKKSILMPVDEFSEIED
ncbi:YgiT-type zinc finger protein [bacterium]|nr:YgiT-type zinc finger protein [bacterium]